MLAAAFLLVFASLGMAQVIDEDFFDPDSAPPPLKVITEDERTQLESHSGLKERTKIALALMSTRLSRAEEFNAKSQFVEMYNELGAFHALMDNTLAYISKSGRRDKTLDTLKRYEMTLRTFAPRLALLRREIPLEYDGYIRALLRYLREARSKAVEPLFGDSVVPRSL